jgi:hypothetical protein
MINNLDIFTPLREEYAPGPKRGVGGSEHPGLGQPWLGEGR